MNAEKRHHSEICIAINDESQGSIAKNLRCDELLYYTFIIHSAGERIFNIGDHLAKLWAKSLTVSYTPFAMHFCHQRCRSRQISWITCVSQGIPSPSHSFTLGLNPYFPANPPYRSLSFFFFRIHSMDFPDCLLLLLSISVFLLFSFFCFYTFLVVGSVR